MKDIHKNLPAIQPEFFTVLDWFFLFATISILVGIYMKFFYLSKEKISKTRNNFSKKYAPVKFSFQRELKKLKTIIPTKNWKEFSLKATQVLKLILEKKYQENFSFATGKELQEILKNKKINSAQKKELTEFFRILDPIKFARKSGQEEEVEKIIKILQDFNKKNYD